MVQDMKSRTIETGFGLFLVVITLAALLALPTNDAQALNHALPPLDSYPGPTPGYPSPDAFEEDDSCEQSKPIGLRSPQQRTFHDETEQDWVRFPAVANQTYIVEITERGANANPALALYADCLEAELATAFNPFGSLLRLQWNSTKNGDYFIRLRPNDPALAGAETDYQVYIKNDDVPPDKPDDLRCFSINTSTIGVQWSRTPTIDVDGYRVNYGRIGASEGGEVAVDGMDTTYAELGGLTAGESYTMTVAAVDFAQNRSPVSGPVTCIAQDPPDRTAPSVSLQNPQVSEIYTTTSNLLTFTGLVQDAGNNLSRVQVVNTTRNDDGWDYSLSGDQATFRVDGMRLQVGQNLVEVTAYDEVGNSSRRTIRVNRLGSVSGAALIVAGHNETYSLQLNIYNAANRTFRVLQAAGYDADDIYYIAPAPQDADGDGVSDVDALASPAAVENALSTWARQGSRTGPDIPFFVYMVDHGLDEKFCVTGCGAGQVVTPTDLGQWLAELEAATGANQVNIVIEACRSGSFITKENGNPLGGLGKSGRVVITSTGADNNAYASADGAYFSDAFFSCAVNHNHFKACFDAGVAAVRATGINQTPWLDDNGDGVFGNDGALAEQRYLASSSTSTAPSIDSASVVRTGQNAILEATVAEGVEEIGLVWATLVPRSFVEPDIVTLNLNAPTVQLDPVPGQAGKFRFVYTNGLTDPDDYRVVYYAQDVLGYHAAPVVRMTGEKVFLPAVQR